MTLTPLEVGTFLVYLAAVIAIGFVSGRKGKESTADFFLAGRRLPWYVIGFSLIASSISSEQFIGEVGWGYRFGMAVANWEWLVFLLGVSAVPGGLPAIIGTGDRAHLMLPADHPELPWTGMLAVAFVMSGYYYSTNQFITQRCLSAKTVWDGKMAVILAGFLAIPLALAVTWPGMIAYALNPGLDNPDAAYPYLISTLIPIGFRGLVFAVLIGAIMSTLDSLVNSTSSLLTLDIYKAHLRKGASDRQLVTFAQLSGAGILVFGALWSPMVGRFGSIFAYAQDCWALMLAPVMAVFVLALFWKRMSRTAAIVVLFSSFPMLFIVFLRELFGILADFNIFNLSAIAFLVFLGVGAGISLVTPDPAPPTPETLWRPELLRTPEGERPAGDPLWKRIGFWYSVLVGCFVVIYAVFW